MSEIKSNPLFQDSDKAFWHRYLDFYERELQKLTSVRNILEFGVFKGNSVRWLLDRFPEAQIKGCDILPLQKEWPLSDRVSYIEMDQASRPGIKRLFNELDVKFDLIIEDGSHIPAHQRNCLIESLKFVTQGGLYILEDVHTSHPQHSLYQETCPPNTLAPLHLLLAFEHMKRNNITLTPERINSLSGNSFFSGSKSLFTSEEVSNLFEKIKSIKIYKRSELPDQCYKCGSQDFNYHSLQCLCGVNIYETSDSMSIVIQVC